MLITTVNVSLDHVHYPIYIGDDLLQDTELLQRHIIASQVFIVTNETIEKLYLAAVKKTFQKNSCDVIVLPDGEKYKNLQTLSKIFDVLLEKKHHRTTTLVALGGGVICDMTGFAAACYQRGVGFIQIPTSLLAQVDASIGGKTGVNHPAGKNMIGAFHQPQCVIIDTTVLNTLPEREFYAGMAEIIKAAVIRDAQFFDWLEEHMTRLLQRDPEALQYAIKRSCEIKAEVVMMDEKEISRVRALLNFGHTLGHAIEQVLSYQTLLHGEAVAIGMVFAAQLSQELGMIGGNEVDRIRHLLVRAHLPVYLPSEIQCDRIMTAIARDKKFSDANMRWVLLQALGKAVIVENIKQDLIETALRSRIQDLELGKRA